MSHQVWPLPSSLPPSAAATAGLIMFEVKSGSFGSCAGEQALLCTRQRIIRSHAAQVRKQWLLKHRGLLQPGKLGLTTFHQQKW